MADYDGAGARPVTRQRLHQPVAGSGALDCALARLHVVQAGLPTSDRAFPSSGRPEQTLAAFVGQSTARPAFSPDGKHRR
jgi:hypothetical protein